MTYENDIPLDAAIGAHRGTSFVPEKRGEQVRDDYSQTLHTDYADLSRFADTKEKQEILQEEFARYRQGFKAKYLAYLTSKGRVVSSMIAGPSNFPVRRMQKANDAEHKRSLEVNEFRERALKAIKRKLTPELQPVKSSDSDAVERLRAKIEKAEKDQATMKAANKAIRKHKKAGEAEQVAALVKLGYSEPGAKVLIDPDFCGRVGYPDYRLTNNNANIRRMKQRMEKIGRDQATPDTVEEGEGARLEDCPSDNRVRLFFDGKPSEEIRQRLKSSGFRWARTLGCWQAYRNQYALDQAKGFAGLCVPGS